MAAAQRGDREAFGELYSRYAGAVSGFVGRRVGDRGLVEDFTSETFTRAWRGIGSVADRGPDVGAWLHTIARNLVADHYKSARCQRETVVAEVPDAATRRPGPEQAVIARETAAALRRHVAELPADQRECLRLRYLDGLPVAETAVAMGRHPGAVKSLTHRGLVALRRGMAAESDPDPPVVARGGDPPAVDPLASARQAVAEVQRCVTDTADRAAERQRAAQPARWHSEDQAHDTHPSREQEVAVVAGAGGGP